MKSFLNTLLAVALCALVVVSIPVDAKGHGKPHTTKPTTH